MPVWTAVCRVSLRIASARSLKDKRQVARSLVDRIRRRFNASVAEVEDQEVWSSLVLGIAAVSGSGQHASRQIEAVLEFIEVSHPEVEIMERHVELVSD
ncbi:MAG: DUF503 domain-containing protein [Chloroflexota bacterium]